MYGCEEGFLVYIHSAAAVGKVVFSRLPRELFYFVRGKYIAGSVNKQFLSNVFLNVLLKYVCEVILWVSEHIRYWWQGTAVSRSPHFPLFHQVYRHLFRCLYTPFWRNRQLETSENA